VRLGYGPDVAQGRAGKKTYRDQDAGSKSPSEEAQPTRHRPRWGRGAENEQPAAGQVIEDGG
jgi:hypothetical protein